MSKTKKLIIILLILIVVDGLAAFAYFNSQTVKVPDLVGKNIQEAIK